MQARAIKRLKSDDLPTAESNSIYKKTKLPDYISVVCNFPFKTGLAYSRIAKRSHRDPTVGPALKRTLHFLVKTV